MAAFTLVSCSRKLWTLSHVNSRSKRFVLILEILLNVHFKILIENDHFYEGRFINGKKEGVSSTTWTDVKYRRVVTGEWRLREQHDSRGRRLPTALHPTLCIPRIIGRAAIHLQVHCVTSRLRLFSDRFGHTCFTFHRPFPRSRTRRTENTMRVYDFVTYDFLLQQSFPQARFTRQIICCILYIQIITGHIRSRLLFTIDEMWRLERRVQTSESPLPDISFLMFTAIVIRVCTWE